MIFYTKLTKLKKLNKRSFSRPSFTVLELVIVIVIIGILAYSLNFKFFNPSLEAAADKLMKDIRYTQSLALKEDKYQPFPLHSCDGSDEGNIECNRSKYWFKQWWQLRLIRSENGEYYYEIFSDSPLFDKKGGPVNEYAINPLDTKYMAGNYHSSTATELNLSKYNIKMIVDFDGNDFNSSNESIRIIFDNFGNVFLNESNESDDINPLDYDYQPILTNTKNIKLCLNKPCNFDKDRCIQINVTPSGYIYKSSCK
jgi:hypothetical protein